MKLSTKAIGLINRGTMLKLALGLDFSEVWVEKLVEKNKNNGPLTTAKALQIISEETGLADQDILEEVKEPAN